MITTFVVLLALLSIAWNALKIHAILYSYDALMRTTAESRLVSRSTHAQKQQQLKTFSNHIVDALLRWRKRRKVSGRRADGWATLSARQGKVPEC